MALPFFKWSKTAASNASADPTVNWSEGQAPSSVNDSARAMMASNAAFRDDISGALTTGGTSTAYTLSSNQVFDSLANMSNAMIAFVPHTTSGATVTLNIDSLGAKPLRSAPSVELPSGYLIQGTPYVATYNGSDGAWYIQGGVSNPYNVPLGGMLPYIASTAPNSAFVLPVGQAISRTTYATLFSLVSTTYGTGDGSTTFNVPDLRGRVVCAPDGMGGSSANRINSVVSNFLGAVGGAQQATLNTGNLPPYTPVGSVTGTPQVRVDLSASTGGAATGGAFFPDQSTNLAASGAGTRGNQTYNVNMSGVAFAGNAQGGTSTPFNTVQPTIAVNFILRII